MQETRNIKNILESIDKDHFYLLTEIGKISKEINQKSYLVGGMVRDLILGFDNLDIDIVVENNAALLADALISKIPNCELSAKHDRFHTAKVVFTINGKKIPIDLASTRKEIYTEAAGLPVPEKVSTLKEDLKRRDFTINALAVSIMPEKDFGNIVDCFNGCEDLIINQEIKAVPNNDRYENNIFIEDPTRMIRAIRFATKLGFKIEKKTKKLLEETMNSGKFDNLIEKVRGDRVKTEIRYLFNLSNIEEAINIFFESGVYRIVNTKLIDRKSSKEIISETKKLVEKYKIEEKWLIYLGILVNDLFIEKSEDPLTQLQLSGREISIVRGACSKSIELKSKTNLNTMETFKELNSLSTESILIIRGLNPSLSPHIDKYLNETSKIKLEINGQDLISLGIPTGKQIGEILEKVLEVKINNPNMSKDDELKLAKESI